MKLKNTLQEKNITKDNMQHKNVIVVISEEVEVFGNFKKMCVMLLLIRLKNN